MNYTSNHHLPQWVNSDRVRMDDFNAAMANIDSGMASATKTANHALSTAVSAQSTANSAKIIAYASYSPENKPYVVGSYTGTSANQTIELGFMPSFLIVSGMQTSSNANDTSPFDRYFAIVGSTGSIVGQQLQLRIQLTHEGFSVFKAGNGGTALPLLNEPDRTYYYIAFR